MARGDNKCVTCGEFAGVGHQCTVTVPDARITPTDSPTANPALVEQPDLSQRVAAAQQEARTLTKKEQAAADRREELHQRLTQGIRELQTSEDWVNYLQFASNFHNYSFNNTMMIYVQCRNASQVAGYNKWSALGRQVKKGEKAIYIWVPGGGGSGKKFPRTGHGSRKMARSGCQCGKCGQTRKDLDEGSTGGVRFYLAPVFDVSQTEGDPLPESPVKLLEGQAPAGLWDGLADQVKDAGFTLERGDCGTANGYTDFRNRVVRVRDDVSDAQAVKTLAHELAHVTLHDPEKNDGEVFECRGRREVEAESVAYLTTAHAGMDSQDYTFGYVLGWASSEGKNPEDVVKETGTTVMKTAKTITGKLDERTETNAASPAPELVTA